MTGKELFDRAGEELTTLRVQPALELYRSAEEAGFDPDQCAAGRWSCCMLAGEFELAWRESDGIAQRGTPDPHRFWDGQPLTGRSVMLRCLHGLGDTLQFIRYAPLIRREAKALTIEAPPKLKQLLEQAHLADRVITWGEPEWSAEQPPWDQQIEVMELPLIFRTTIESIPRSIPYIDVPHGDVFSINGSSRAPTCANSGHRVMCVGLVWASGLYDAARSIPIEGLVPLFDIPGVSFVSLQAGAEGSQIEPWAPRVIIPPEELTGIFATAKIVKTLDLVITVDTMTAHLAGAMGRPVWTLLPYECDWRWMLGRADSPWYPTMRLFRQRERGDWNPVVDSVRRELTAQAAAPRPTQAYDDASVCGDAGPGSVK